MSVQKTDYEKDKTTCREFLETCTNDLAAAFKYRDQIRRIAMRKERVIVIDLDDIYNHTNAMEGRDFLERIEYNGPRYKEIFHQAIDDMIDELYEKENLTVDSKDEDVTDVMWKIRKENQNEQANNDAPVDPLEGFPKELRRKYEIHFKSTSKTKTNSLREVKAENIGRIVQIKAMVTRVSNVKPLVTVATYTCDTCGYEVYQQVSSRQYTPLVECASSTCKTNQSKGKLFPQTRGSKFEKYQEIKIQELPDQVPVGNIPRAMNLICRGELTRQAFPGDIITVTGIYLPTPYTGSKRMSAGLISDTYVEATYIQKHKKTETKDLSPELEAKIFAARADEDMYSKLSQSLAPEIYGHDDVKRALLLQLVSGVTKNMNDGMKIRGDINICLMGDPGLAKSQLLKHICTVARRAVYTTGKGSSGVGLTAAVVKDPLTNEMTLEGGALVLGDMGICCIDEFDKMEDADRTAIHEVMEQQTVSIAKAGITTTLNARTAILAAANPLYGRYNKKKSIAENVNLPAALLSRFDLLFLILDKHDRETDLALARHITYVHQHNEHPPLSFEPLSGEFIRAFIDQAKAIDPFIPQEIANNIVENYVAMRENEKRSATENGERALMTARQLLSILRMSQALARLRFSKQVDSMDVEEAIRLVDSSKSSLCTDEDANAGGGNTEDVTSRIYSIIRDYAANRELTVLNYSDIEPLVIKRGFKSEQLAHCIQSYADLNVWQINNSRTKLEFTS